MMRLPKSLTLALTMTMLFLATGAEAASFYCVRGDATGNNSGSDWNNAYTALPVTLERGAIYYIADGSYAGRTLSTATSGSTYITIRKATIVDHGTDTGWQASYGDGQAAFTSGIDFESSYWIFDGATGGGPGKWDNGYGFKITETRDAKAAIITGYKANVDYVTIRHVELQGKGSISTQGGGYSNDGIAINGNSWTYDPSNITLSYAWMHGIGRCPIYFQTGGRDHLFEYLYITSYFASSAVHSEVMSTTDISGDVTFRFSLITDVQGTGGLMWDNSNNPNARLYVYGNIFYRPSGSTWQATNGIIGGWTGASGEQFHNCLVYNNVFINIDKAPLSTNPSIASGNIAYNNLFYNSNSPNFGKFATHDYNHFINSGGAHLETHGTSALSGDPFVDYVNLNFSLTGHTASGIPLPSPFDTDPLGNKRTTWDRGAFEYSTDGSHLYPPSRLRIE